MTLGELMQHVMRLQAQARQVGEAFGAYEGWRADVPGEGADYCASTVENIVFLLDMVRDTLRDELRATPESEGASHD